MVEKLLVRRIVCGAYAENAYIARIDGAGEAVAIDPGDLSEAQLDEILGGETRIGAVLLTHGHFDHTLAAGRIAERFGAQMYIHELDLPMLEDETLNAYKAQDASPPPPEGFGARVYPAEDGEGFEVCGIRFQLLHTPGHTPGSVCLYCEDAGALFSGDTLFAGAFGRVDLAGGSAMQMRRSLKRLLALPEATAVYAGHIQPTTIGAERAHYHMENR